MRINEGIDLADGINKIVSQLRERRFSDYHDQLDRVFLYGGQFIWLIADALVMCDSNPTIVTDQLQPFLIGSSRREMRAMSMNNESSGSKNVGELLA